MGAAVRISKPPEDAISRTRVIDDIFRSLPEYFELDLSVALRFDLSMPSVRLAHVLIKPIMRRLEGVQLNTVCLVFGYAMERLIGFSVAGMDPVAARLLRKRLHAFIELEKAIRCLNFFTIPDHFFYQTGQQPDMENFPIGRVSFESTDGQHRFVVDGAAMHQIGKTLQRLQGLPMRVPNENCDAYDPERSLILDHLKHLAFGTMLQSHDITCDAMEPGRSRLERTRLIRHLYRFLMHHARPQTFMHDRWMRKLMYDVSTLTYWPLADIIDLAPSTSTGKFSVMSQNI